MNSLPQIAAGMRLQDNQDKDWCEMLLASSGYVAYTGWGVLVDYGVHPALALKVDGDLHG